MSYFNLDSIAEDMANKLVEDKLGEEIEHDLEEEVKSKLKEKLVDEIEQQLESINTESELQSVIEDYDHCSRCDIVITDSHAQDVGMCENCMEESMDNI